MFSENKSELSIPVVGFMLLGFAALFAGAAMLDMEWGFLNNVSSDITGAAFLAAGVLLGLAALFSFREVFLIEGMTFGVLGLFMFVLGYGTPGALALDTIGFLGFGLAVIALITAFMSFRAGDLYITFIGILTAASMSSAYFADSTAGIAVAGGCLIVAAVIALAYALMDWMLVQDVATEIAEYMYGDEDDDHACCCGEHED